jgi:predicted small integral membrane protein
MKRNAMLRIVKIVLVVLVAVWGLIGGIKNFADVGGGLDAVQAVMNPPESVGLPNWQRVSNPIAIWIGWLIMPLGKLGAAGLCALGAWRMWASRKLESMLFNQAKELAIAGCGVAVAMLFGGFFVIGEVYFDLWMTPLGEVALPNAFRMIGCIGVIALLVAQKD